MGTLLIAQLETGSKNSDAGPVAPDKAGAQQAALTGAISTHSKSTT